MFRAWPPKADEILRSLATAERQAARAARARERHGLRRPADRDPHAARNVVVAVVEVTDVLGVGNLRKRACSADCRRRRGACGCHSDRRTLRRICHFAAHGFRLAVLGAHRARTTPSSRKIGCAGGYHCDKPQTQSQKQNTSRHHARHSPVFRPLMYGQLHIQDDMRRLEIRLLRSSSTKYRHWNAGRKGMVPCTLEDFLNCPPRHTFDSTHDCRHTLCR